MLFQPKIFPQKVLDDRLLPFLHGLYNLKTSKGSNLLATNTAVLGCLP